MGWQWLSEWSQGADTQVEERVIDVADAYDAMASVLSYKTGMGRDEAFIELKRYAESQFDSEIVKVFVNEVLSESRD